MVKSVHVDTSHLWAASAGRFRSVHTGVWQRESSEGGVSRVFNAGIEQSGCLRWSLKCSSAADEHVRTVHRQGYGRRYQRPRAAFLWLHNISSRHQRERLQRADIQTSGHCTREPKKRTVHVPAILVLAGLELGEAGVSHGYGRDATAGKCKRF